MTLEEICEVLAELRTNFSSRDNTKLARELAEHKKDAILGGDEPLAKEIWCLEQVLKAHEAYVRGFAHCKLREFYAGWCAFEDTAVAVHHLKRHFRARRHDFQLNFLEKHIDQFQRMFPYKLFFSTGMMVRERTCTICGAIKGLRTNCAHLKGEIYQGVMAAERISKFDLLEVSLVDDPVDKRCVAFRGNVDDYNYVLVDYITGALVSPFDSWDVEETFRYERHEKFEDVGRNDKCPCGSGKKYKKCCSSATGVKFPHFELKFDVPPPATTKSFMLASERDVRSNSVRNTSLISVWPALAPIPEPLPKLAQELA